MLVKTTDGTPDAVKVARPVWSGGKSGDNFKGLPIAKYRNRLRPSPFEERIQYPDFQYYQFQKVDAL